jgi:hypothetical protein
MTPTTRAAVRHRRWVTGVSSVDATAKPQLALLLAQLTHLSGQEPHDQADAGPRGSTDSAPGDSAEHGPDYEEGDDPGDRLA